MKLDWNRIKRTLIQSASGAGVALITAVCADFSKGSIITAIITFFSTVGVAVLMNINKQTEEEDQDG